MCQQDPTGKCLKCCGDFSATGCPGCPIQHRTRCWCSHGLHCLYKWLQSSTNLCKSQIRANTSQPAAAVKWILGWFSLQFYLQGHRLSREGLKNSKLVIIFGHRMIHHRHHGHHMSSRLIKWQHMNLIELEGVGRCWKVCMSSGEAGPSLQLPWTMHLASMDDTLNLQWIAKGVVLGGELEPSHPLLEIASHGRYTLHLALHTPWPVPVPVPVTISLPLHYTMLHWVYILYLASIKWCTDHTYICLHARVQTFTTRPYRRISMQHRIVSCKTVYNAMQCRAMQCNAYLYKCMSSWVCEKMHACI
jgi:hypothetical protein